MPALNLLPAGMRKERAGLLGRLRRLRLDTPQKSAAPAGTTTKQERLALLRSLLLERFLKFCKKQELLQVFVLSHYPAQNRFTRQSQSENALEIADQEVGHRWTDDVRTVMAAMNAIIPQQGLDRIGTDRRNQLVGIVHRRDHIQPAMNHERRALDIRRVGGEIDALIEGTAFLKILAAGHMKEAFQRMWGNLRKVTQVIHHAPCNQRFDA